MLFEKYEKTQKHIGYKSWNDDFEKDTCPELFREKYKREFDEGNIYNGIWGTLQTLFVFTACIILFILVHICGIPQYKLSIALGTIILCIIVVNAIIKKLKQDRYVQIIHEEYLKMTEEERKKHYKRGLWKVTPIFFYPIIIIAFLKLITLIY